MDTSQLDTLREQLAKGLSGGEAHTTFEKTVKEFPAQQRNAKPKGAPHSAWEIVEHMRITQWDILEFSRDPKHKSPHFPDGYWPKSGEPGSEDAWDGSVQSFLRNRQEMADLIRQEDLFQPIAHGDGQTLLREAMLVANHNSYQLGELVFLKRMLTE